LGFSAGLETGIGLLNPPLEGDVLAQDTGWIRPSIAWENNRVGGGLELSAAMGIPFWVTRKAWAGMDIDLSAGYELDLSFTNSLAFILENETFIPFADDKAAPLNVALDYADVESRASNWLIPGLRFTQELKGIGNFYAQLDFPLYLAGAEDPLSLIGLDFRLTLFTDAGFGIEVFIQNSIKNADGEASFCDYVYLTPSYGYGPFYGVFGVGIPAYKDGIDNEGFTLTPGVQYAIIDAVTVYTALIVSQLKPPWNPPAFGLNFGVVYSF
jgi:hypothetical protein